MRFGAQVTFRYLTGKQKGNEQTFQLVGVDEANIKERKIAFLAPLAKALTGKKKGEIAQVHMAGAKQELEIIKISYS